jgi:fatty acid desaturase
MIDRALRAVLGFALIIAALSGFVWGWIGLIPLVTAAIGFCPLYAVLGINTGCKTAE